MSFPSQIPDREIEKVVPMLHQQIASACEGVHAGSQLWQKLFDSGASALFDICMREADASEGSIWLLDRSRDALVPAHNNGPAAAKFVNVHRQPLDRGMVSTVFATQSGINESWVYKNPQHDSKANEKLNVVTVHMIALPFYFGGETRGVVSAVKLRRADEPASNDPEPFTPQALTSVRRLSLVLGEILDARLLRSVLGMR